MAAWYDWTSIVGIWSLGAMVGISLTFLGMGLNEKNKQIKYLILFPIAWFFGILFFTYILNEPIDRFIDKTNTIDLFQTNKMNITYMLTLLICFVHYFLKH